MEFRCVYSFQQIATQHWPTAAAAHIVLLRIRLVRSLDTTQIDRTPYGSGIHKHKQARTSTHRAHEQIDGQAHQHTDVRAIVLYTSLSLYIYMYKYAIYKEKSKNGHKTFIRNLVVDACGCAIRIALVL